MENNINSETKNKGINTVDSSTIKVETLKEFPEKTKALEENTTEKALVKKGETSLKTRNTYMIQPILKTTVGVLFYTASFIVSMAIGYTFIFSVFNQ